ncbi:ATP-binding protein [Pseudoalteromonas fenneropenaei]|uniref:histidine kinase n=1 Tax=Pseudoalteromonas fenneropenaei TaxID=1737459 RepID=A0ABV7CEL4_9GAMM
MQNNTSSPFKGFMPLFIAIALAAAALAGYAGYQWPKQSQSTVVESFTEATPAIRELADSLANSMMKLGFSNAKQLIHGMKVITPQYDYYLFSHTGMSEATLLTATGGESIKALSQDKTLVTAQATMTHILLKLDDQLVGELVVVQPVTSSASGSELAYLFALLSAIFACFGAWLVCNRASGGLCASVSNIETDLQHIIKEQDYTAIVDEDSAGNLSGVANAINQLLRQVQTSITQNKTAERELKQLQTGLETEVQARTLALEKATLNAERANEAKTTFLATMSHEIRTPMNGVIGTIDLLRQTELNGAQHRLTTIIRDSAFSLLGILDDILDFSKIEAGKLTIDNSVFSVTDTIEEVARVLSSVAKKRRLDLQLSIAPDIPDNLVGDSVRVRQVLYNLCSNAIKFTTTDEDRQGFVRISVEVAQNTSDHYTLRFTVTDNGKGMTQAQLREIFNPFIQAESTITREYGGTGLGLSICKSLIELMLGSIHVTSDIGMGSEFVVELPFSTRGKIAYANKATLKGYNVVLLTQSQWRKAILSRYLSFMGANLIVAESELDIDDYQQQDKVIWILDALDGMTAINNTLRSLLYSIERFEQQAIVLSKMDEAALNHQKIFYLNAAPLCKSSFMTSVLVGAGLHTPKTLKPATSFNNYLNIDEARAQNKLVLLVEDNILNQQVLTDQLHLLGYGVEVAENGQQGLELWQSGQFPLILTDLHMPKMSGYDMVTKIRDLAEQSSEPNAQPYIIAVTANALKGERERCLASGMNDYITKPIELNVLEATLNKWREKQPRLAITEASPDAQSDTTVTTPMPDVPSQPAAIDLEALNKYVNNDAKKRQRFFKMYLEQAANLISDINSGVMAMDQEVIIDACHQLKSISKTIGALVVADKAMEFETSCKERKHSSDELIRARDNLELAYSQAVVFIEKILAEGIDHE